MRGLGPVCLLIGFLVGCHRAPVAPPDAQSDAGVCAPDAPDSGFGLACTPDQEVPPPCTTCAGETGWCAFNVCRRRCTGPGYTGCPPGFNPTPIVGDQCDCEPPDAGADAK